MAEWARHISPRPGHTLDALLVGSATDCHHFAGSMALGGSSGYRPIGFLDVQNPPRAGALGHIDDAATLLPASGARAVVVCSSIRQRHLASVADIAITLGCQLLSASSVVETDANRPGSIGFDGRRLVHLTEEVPKGWGSRLKRAIDVVGSTIGLTLMAPIMMCIAFAIRVESSGPAIFEQERVGAGGRVFRIFKFRTMANGAEAAKASVSPTLTSPGIQGSLRSLTIPG